LDDVGSRSLRFRLRSLDCLGCSASKEVILRFRVAPVNVISSIAPNGCIANHTVANGGSNRFGEGSLERWLLPSATQVECIVARSTPVVGCSFGVFDQRYTGALNHGVLQNGGSALVFVVLGRLFLRCRLFILTLFLL
jgi:hypothetical protein